MRTFLLFTLISISIAHSNAQELNEFNEAIDKWTGGDAPAAALVFIKKNYFVDVKETTDEEIILFKNDDHIIITKTDQNNKKLIIYMTPRYTQWAEMIKQLEQYCEPFTTNDAHKDDLSKEDRWLWFYCGDRIYQYQFSKTNNNYSFTVSPKNNTAQPVEVSVPYSQSALFYCARAFTKLSNKDYYGAKTDYNKAIEIEPSEGLYYFMRGTLDYIMKDLQKAVSDFTKAINFNHNLQDAFLYRGQSKLELKDFRGCIEDFNKVIEINPNSGDAYYLRGMAKINMGNIEKGCLDLSRAGEQGSKFDVYKSIKDICN